MESGGLLAYLKDYLCVDNGVALAEDWNNCDMIERSHN